jgi:hypothetical protein
MSMSTENIVGVREAFDPKPEDWWKAKLVRVTADKRILSTKLTNGDLVFIHERDITFAPHGHYFCLPCDGSTEVVVRIEPNPVNNTHRWRALEAQFVVEEFEPLRERGHVQDWRPSGYGNCGSIRRFCQCGIFAKGNDTDPTDFVPSDEVEFEVSFNERRGRFTAYDVKLVKRSKQS